MRYLVLTDIHANLEALDACLEDAAPRGWDAAVVLGDLVGYGADPNAVIARVRALAPRALVRGNHDKAALDPAASLGFNAAARHAALWTVDALSPEHRGWLARLPQGPLAVDDFVEICHGTPGDEDVYIFDGIAALGALRASTRPLCLYGHTHHPAIFALVGTTLDADLPCTPAESRVTLRDGAKYLANPGAVGQPRDGDPRAAYAIVDTSAREVTFLRVAYPIETAQRKIRDAGLPDALARRLASGR